MAGRVALGHRLDGADDGEEWLSALGQATDSSAMSSFTDGAPMPTITFTGNSTSLVSVAQGRQVEQAGNEEAVGTGLAIRTCSPFRLVEARLGRMVGTEPNIAAGVDEDRDAAGCRRGSHGAQTVCLLVDIAQSARCCLDGVFDVDADGTALDHDPATERPTADGVAPRPSSRSTVTGTSTRAQDRLHQRQHVVERHQFCVPDPRIERDAEAGRADGRCASCGHDGGRHLVPGIDELEWAVSAVELAEPHGTFVLRGAFRHGLNIKPAALLVNGGVVVAQFSPMATASREPIIRRTQNDRRDATRRKVLDAAVECLIDRGYAATSVVDVQQRAGLSRGALQHYWPSRASLTVDAVKALFDAMASPTAQRDGDPCRPAAPTPILLGAVHVAIALLWSSFDSSLFRAELELWVAARHDAELRPLVVAHDRRLGAEIVELCHDMFGPELSSHPRFTEAIGLLTHGMRGAALVVDLHPNHRQHLVAEWHRQICLTLDVPIDPATS